MYRNIPSIVRRLTGLLTVVLTLVGCHVYRPSEPNTVGRGRQVEVVLSDSARAGLARRTVRFERRIVGEVLEVGEDSVRVVSPRGNREVGDATGLIRDTLPLPRGGIRQLRVREVDALRTAGLAAGGVAGVVGFALMTTSEPTESGFQPDPDDTGEASISIPVPLPFP